MIVLFARWMLQSIYLGSLNFWNPFPNFCGILQTIVLLRPSMIWILFQIVEELHASAISGPRRIFLNINISWYHRRWQINICIQVNSRSKINTLGCGIIWLLNSNMLLLWLFLHVAKHTLENIIKFRFLDNLLFDTLSFAFTKISLIWWYTIRYLGWAEETPSSCIIHFIWICVHLFSGWANFFIVFFEYFFLFLWGFNLFLFFLFTSLNANDWIILTYVKIR